MASDDDVMERAVTRAAEVAARVAVELIAVHGRHTDVEPLIQRHGEFWTLRYDGLETHLGDCRGLQHIARLLATPGEPVHALELTTGHAGSCALRGTVETAALDATARAAYRGRLAALDAEIETARDHADLARAELAAHEREFLMGELSRSVGLHGRDRALGSPVERARVAVTKAIRTATRHVHAHHTSLGAHLEACVRTGTWCCYTSDTVWNCGDGGPSGRR